MILKVRTSTAWETYARSTSGCIATTWSCGYFKIYFSRNEQFRCNHFITKAYSKPLAAYFTVYYVAYNSQFALHAQDLAFPKFLFS